MSRTAPSARASDPLRSFTREVASFGGGKHQPWRVFSDFCELAALSLAQVPFNDTAREARYLAVAKAYDADQLQAFARLVSYVVAGLDDAPCDFLGSAFQQLELANHWRGQFFTPWHLALAMAELQLGDGALLKERPFITVSDPACGAGVMLLAFAAAVHGRGFNPQTCVHAHAQDVDETAARMCFIQLALIGQPATVVIGNTLSLEVREVLHTPAHHLGFWRYRLAAEEAHVAAASPTSEPTVAPPQPGQLTLFADQEVEAA